MEEKTKIFALEIICDFAEWWRYNVHIMLVGYNQAGEQLTFANLSDRVYDMDYNDRGRKAPQGYDMIRRIRVESGPCYSAQAYLYVVANTFPSSAEIKDSPPFQLTMRIFEDGKVKKDEILDVNQWGGLTLAEYDLR